MITTLIAQGAPAADPLGGMGMWIPMVFMVGIFYFMILRPQQRREKERRELIENAKKGQRVVFCGGLVGVIANVKDDRFMVKVDDNTRVEVLKGAITQVLEKGDTFEDEAAPR